MGGKRLTLIAAMFGSGIVFLDSTIVPVALPPIGAELPSSLRFHWSGAAVVALAVGGLTFGAIRGQAQAWDDPVAYVALALGALGAIYFPIAMKRAPNPLVPLGLFRSRNFSVTNLSTLVIYGAIYVTMQYLALFMIGILGYDEVSFGVATAPSAVLMALFSARFGALAARHGPRLFMTVGPALMGLGLLWYARIPGTSQPWRIGLGSPGTLVPSRDFVIDVLPAIVVFGIGLTVMVAPLTTALMCSVPVANSCVASAFNNAVSRVGPQPRRAYPMAST